MLHEKVMRKVTLKVSWKSCTKKLHEKLHEKMTHEKVTRKSVGKRSQKVACRYFSKHIPNIFYRKIHKLNILNKYGEKI